MPEPSNQTEPAGQPPIPNEAEQIEETSEEVISESSLPHEQTPSVDKTPVRARRRIYLNTNYLPDPSESYVAWLDVMGSGSAMSQSLLRSSNHISRLHIAILMNRNWDLQTSPFMDGAYIRSTLQRPILDFLWGVFEELAFDFMNAKEHRHRFMPRCGLSYGSIIQGVNIPTTVSKILGAFSNQVYREGIYFGYPMVQANRSEADAPPFGIAIHESARGFSPPRERALSGVWWRWHLYRQVDFLPEFVKILMDYFDWCEGHSIGLGYPVERIKAHKAMAREYFDSEAGV